MSLTNSSSTKTDEVVSRDDLIQKILYRGQRLRNAMVQSILDHDPFNTEIFNDHQAMNLVPTRLRKRIPSQCSSLNVVSSDVDKQKLRFFLKGESMSRQDQVEALEMMKSMSSEDVCKTTNEVYSFKCNCATCQNYDDGELNCDLKRFKRNIDLIDEENLLIEEKLKFRKSNEIIEYLNYVDSLKISVHNLKLNDTGNKKVHSCSKFDKTIGFWGSPTFFVEYEIPFVLSVSTSCIKIKKSSFTARNNNFVRICARQTSSEDVIFKHLSLHDIKNMDQMNLRRLKLKFRITCRLMKQKTVVPLGHAFFNFENFQYSSTLTCIEELPVIFDESVPIVLGNLCVTLQMGYGRLYFGNEFIGWRKLLKGVNGIFKSGELTAILGPSGAGKSTLLNILAGYVSAGVKGTIKMNDIPRDMKKFNKLSSYILQEDIIQPRLTVKESMLIAANLKLGSGVSYREKLTTVEEICGLLGLERCYETRTEYLSGGQKKRLAVGLELVNNPPVIFLDEPTTGLDNFAIKKCMDLLHNISKEGRTVICTIHQPPTSLFQSFDQVYVLANGFCVYNGSPSELVPFLVRAQFDCPQSYTPAEYIIEILQEVPETVTILAAQTQNGKANLKPKITAHSNPTTPWSSSEIYHETTQMGLSDMNLEYPVSLWAQFVILLGRMFLQLSRNKSTLYIQFFHHLASAFLIGGVFYGIGNNASQMVSSFKLLLCVTVFFMYTYVMTSTIVFPLEVKMMRREYFNRWYSLKAYYLAVTVCGLPMLIILGLMFSVIVYTFTDQPMELDRFLHFSIMGICVGLASQGLGFAIGAAFNILNGCVMAPLTLAPLLVFAIYGMGFRDSIEPHMKVLMTFSYLRLALEGYCNSLFYKRAPLDCEDEIYCHYSNPSELMRDMGMADSNYVTQLIGVLGFMLLFRIAAYAILKYRMSAEFSTKIAYYATKIIHSKEY